ncbi:serine hydrolase [Ornithinimicrobium sp. Y1694]|uniref:serine hydrolase n=1 Tax=Ornithinimicrobium sp. Y1694 TaxID=3418590 RepID=UPI003CEC0AD0
MGGARRVRSFGMVLSVAVLLAGCSSAEAPDNDGTTEEATVGEEERSGADVTADGATVDEAAQSEADVRTAGATVAPEGGPSRTAVDPADEISDEVLLEQTSWVLEHLEQDASGPRAEMLGERFSPDFLDQVPAFQLAMVFPQLRAGGPYTVTEVAEISGAERGAALALAADQQPLRMTITVDPDGRISGLLFVNDTSGEPPELSSWSDLDEVLEEMGGTSQVVVAQVEDGACAVLHTTEGVVAGGEPAPTGSVFKLLVLAGLVDAVEAGEIAWTDELTLTEEVKSFPSGILQDRDAGEIVTVREAAELMISISDNTATDLLIAAVGQDRLAAAMTAAGVDAERVAPITTTKELFILGWGVDQEVRDRWRAAGSVAGAGPDQRAAILDELPTDLADVDIASISTPVWQDGVDWLLTGEEICQVHARLQAQATTPAGEPVRDILSANPGGTVPEGVVYQGFKGGSAPGVLALSYYLEPGGATELASDGSATDTTAAHPGTGLVLVIQTSAEQDIDYLRAGTIADAALQHLADTGG